VRAKLLKIKEIRVMLEESLGGENSIVLLKLPPLFLDYLNLSISSFQGPISHHLHSQASQEIQTTLKTEKKEALKREIEILEAA